MTAYPPRGTLARIIFNDSSRPAENTAPVPPLKLPFNPFHPTVSIMADNATYITATDANFESEVLGSDQPVLVDFWATWCGPCRVIAPTIEEIAHDYEGKARVAKLDVDNNPQTAMQYGIRSIPSLVFFKDGRPVDQLVGVVPKNVLAQKLDALVGQEA